MTSLMSLKLNGDDERLNPQRVASQLCSLFPETEIAEGDQMQLEIKRIEASMASDAARAKVLERLKLNAQLYGPSIGFTIPSSTGTVVRGHVRPVDLVFLCDTQPDATLWSRLVEFCKGFGRGSLSVEES